MQNDSRAILLAVSVRLDKRKGLVTCIDDSAKEFNRIYVSGGKRGLDIGLAPQDLLGACHKAIFASIKED